MEDNIDKFNYFVGSVFATLYTSFPCREKLNYLSLIGCEECDETINSSGYWTGLYKKDGEIINFSDDFNFLHETLNWLYETGYLIGSVGTSVEGKYATVTLSPKALEILKAVPDVVEPGENRKSIGDELSDAFNSAAKNKVSELAGRALSYLFKIGWGAAIGVG